MTRFAVFDLDHTITRASTGRRLIEHGRAAGIFSTRDLLLLPYYYARYRAGKLRIDQVAERTMHLEGRTSVELNAVATVCFQKDVRRDIMPGAVELIERHRSDGYEIVLATSSLHLIVRPVAEELGISHVVCTELEFADGVATGGFVHPPCYGEEKERRVTELVKSLGGSLDNVVFYSDSRLDLPLLRAVGTPIVVNPDRGLRREARANHWPILSLS
jgi:HAD superfamily hydrolase (TIGR01490 family)